MHSHTGADLINDAIDNGKLAPSFHERVSSLTRLFALVVTIWSHNTLSFRQFLELNPRSR